MIDVTTRVAKKNEILDCAQRMIYTKGYEDMSIQDIVNELGISKGAFFHYYPSKSALLEAMLERTNELGMAVVTPIVDDSTIPPAQKLERIIQASMQWKSGQKAYLMAILKAWYSDENALVRQKMIMTSTINLGELLKRVFLEGIKQGVFHTDYPEMAGKIVYALMTQMSDSLGHILLHVNSDPPENEKDMIKAMELIICSYTDAIEKILGVESGSIHLIDLEAMKEWIPG
jgi:AcrR family transcriptional regulator